MAEVMPTPGSSNIEQAEYDADAQTLTVTFRSGADYVYSGVPPSVWRQFGLAGSKGQFLNRVVIPRYPAEQA